MSPKLPAVDDQGRPIVAELGRAETPQEIADRKAAATKAHRSNQSLLNLVIALGASLLVVFVIVVVVVRPDQGGSPKHVNWVTVGASAQQAVSTPLIVPKLPSSWTANRAEIEDSKTASDGVANWQIGFLTPSTQYIGLTQGIKANDSWIATQLKDARATGSVTYGGQRWTVYNHRTDADTGNLAYALVTTAGDSTIVLAGTAPTPEFATLATEISGELAG